MMMRMNCIFLDFDGVINNWYCFYGVAKENALVLKKIIALSNAKIVVTASSKYSIQRENCDFYKSDYYNTYVKRLNELGIEIYDLTPMGENRSSEIKKYLLEHDVNEYAIIDDDLVDKDLQEHQVFLDLYRGLQEEHITPVLRILSGKLGFYPKDYNRDETPSELCLRINKYYNEKKK